MDAMRRSAIPAAIIFVVSLMADPIAALDDFYYFDDDQVGIVVSQSKITIQFDSAGGELQGGAAFLAAHPCVTSVPDPEYLGRWYWIYRLQTGWSYAAAAADLLTDSHVKRVVPVYLTASDSAEFDVTDLIAVRFDDDLVHDSALAILLSLGLEVVDTSDYKHNLWRCALADTNSGSPLDIGNDLHQRPGVRWACADVLTKGSRHGLPSDPYFANQYYLLNTGQNGGTPGMDINASQGWDVALQDSAVIVAVIDDGMTYHSDLSASRILPGFDAGGDFRDSLHYDFDPTPDDIGGGHGMACGGILAAGHNTTGIAGVCGSCAVVPVKIFEDNSPWQIAYAYDVGQAIYFASQSGAKVISCSWTFGTYSGWGHIADAIRDAVVPNLPWRNYGCIVVFSAGNNADVPKGDAIGFPGNMPEVITVGAVDKFGNKWAYSQYGSALDVMAPSGNDGRYVSRVGDVWTMDIEGEPGINPPKFYPAWNDIDDVDYTGVFGGTSAAAPQVAGIAALMLGARPDLVTDPVYRDTLNRVVKNILRSTATDIGAPGYDTLTGAGIVNAFAALLPVIIGSGDVTNDGTVDVLDLNLLIDIMAYGGHAVIDDRTGDVDCSGQIDPLDLNYLIDYIFFAGPKPIICLTPPVW